MSLGNVEQRIRKMKDAIKFEAQQRGQNIIQKAKDDADIERNKIATIEKEKIENQYNLKIKAEKVKAKIQKSGLVNRERLRKLKATYELIYKLKDQVKASISDYLKNDETKHKELIKNLLVQGMFRMMQRTIEVSCKKQDQSLIRSVTSQASRQFTSILSISGKQMQSSLQLSTYKLAKENESLIGGILMSSVDGKIVCDNTIDARIDLVFEILLPQIREILFPQKIKHTKN